MGFHCCSKCTCTVLFKWWWSHENIFDCSAQWGYQMYTLAMVLRLEIWLHLTHLIHRLLCLQVLCLYVWMIICECTCIIERQVYSIEYYRNLFYAYLNPTGKSSRLPNQDWKQFIIWAIKSWWGTPRHPDTCIGSSVRLHSSLCKCYSYKAQGQNRLVPIMLTILPIILFFHF